MGHFGAGFKYRNDTMNVTTKSVLKIDKTEPYMSESTIEFIVEKNSDGVITLDVNKTCYGELYIDKDDIQGIIKFLRSFIE